MIKLALTNEEHEQCFSPILRQLRTLEMGGGMRIAQIAPLYEAVPPKLYGGTERVVSWLSEALVNSGHDVTLFASGDSETSANLEAIWPQALRLDGRVHDPHALHMMMIELVARRASEFDLVHFHLDYYPFSLFSRQSTPFLTTLHGRLDFPEHRHVFEMFSSVPLVSISNAQRSPLRYVNWVGTVYHGLPPDLLEPQPASRTYLGFLGRISPEKGLDRAIQVACACGIPLKIAAKVDKADAEYFEAVIRPLLNHENIEYLGEIGDSEKSEFLSKALALLVPISWPEPFGIVMIESMACGTPVIAFNRGSVPEIIDHGLTGFIVENVEEAIDAVHKLDHLSSIAIRRRFEERFTAERMAEDYLDLYRDLAFARARHAFSRRERIINRRATSFSP